VVLELDSGGYLYPKSQMTNYVCHGLEVTHYNLLEYLVDTYEEEKNQINSRYIIGPQEISCIVGRP